MQRRQSRNGNLLRSKLVNDHGRFKSSSNSKTYSLLSELSKLTSYTHGGQRNGKADEWSAYLKTKGMSNHMVSFYVLQETGNCLRTNVLSERDFEQCDMRLSMKVDFQ